MFNRFNRIHTYIKSLLFQRDTHTQLISTYYGPETHLLHLFIHIQQLLHGRSSVPGALHITPFSEHPQFDR